MSQGTARAGQYRQLLHQHLTDRPPSEVEFFVNARRFDILRRTLAPHLRGASILNVASGPFAFEFYMAPQAQRIDCLDVDPALPALHAELRSRGLIGDSRFVLSDVLSFETDERYDVVIINDLFYSAQIDFFRVLDKYAAFLKPGGRLYFDVLDRRAGPIWALFNKDARYRRYDLAKVRGELEGRGLAVEAMVPSIGIKGGLDAFARSLMWGLARIANNVIFMARSSGARAGLLVLSLVTGEYVMLQ